MSPKRAKKFVKFTKYIKGKLHNGVFCSCSIANKGVRKYAKLLIKIGAYDE